MPFYAVLFVAYLGLEVLLTAFYAGAGKSVKITPASAFVTAVTHVLMILAVISLAHS